PNSGLPPEIKNLVPYAVEVPWSGQALALGGAALLLIVIATLALPDSSPLKFLIGKDNRYSNSQTQIALWFGAAMSAYLAMVFVRVSAGGLDYLGGVAITANVLALSGFSAITFGGAKVVTAAKTGGVPPVVPPASPISTAAVTSGSTITSASTVVSTPTVKSTATVTSMPTVAATPTGI